MRTIMVNNISKKERERIRSIFRYLSHHVGSQKKLADELEVGESAISQLIKGNFLPSAKICVMIEAKYGIKKETLRPDIFVVS